MAGRLSTQSTVAVARVGVIATDWVHAVRAAAGLLVEAGAVTTHYVDRSIAIVHAEGPYIVVAPGVALAHARPEDGAEQLAVAAAVLSTPVRFGHPKNDPVDVVIAFSSPDSIAHVSLLSRLAARLAEGLADELRAAASDDDATAVLQEVARDQR
jgi:PTS system ascorbate-specific IIA component